MDPIPLVDLKAQLAEIEPELREGFARVFAKTAFILGPDVAEFEKELAVFSGVSHAVGVANGTDAIEMALRALGIGAGDEVILPANTFIATALAVVRAGATPVLVDCEADTQLLDVEAVETRITGKTRAIIPVHLFGQCAPVERVQAIADETGIKVVEDHAQSQGATRHGRPAGSLAVVAATSFYPGKNLGAFGDAGAVLTSDDRLAAKLRALRNYGSEVKYHHPETGFNSRLDTLQAVVLRAKLTRLARWNEQRREAARRYDALLSGAGDVVVPVTAPGNEHVWHLYVVRVPRRDDVLARLQKAGIGAGIHYPIPIHLQGALRKLGHKEGDFPVAETAAREILSLPMYPEITAAQQERVVRELRAALS